MARIEFHTQPPKQKTIYSLPHGEGCTLLDQPGKVFMRLRTTHNAVQICKTNAADSGKCLIKLLDIITGEIGCYAQSTPCVPVELVVGVYPKESV